LEKSVDGLRPSMEEVHGPIHRASQVAFQQAIEARVPGRAPTGIALFIYASGTGRLVESFLGAVVARHGLDGSQFMVLFTLWCAKPPHRLSPTELHRLLVQSPSGMSHTLRRLGETNLIRRRDDAADGRAKAVELTPKGIRRVQRVVADLLDELDEVYADADDAHLAGLADAQRQVAELLSNSPLSYPVTSRPVGVRPPGDEG
jgi:DNA-binding MarR family transcriptional regulator